MSNRTSTPSRRVDRGGSLFRTLAREVVEDDLGGEAAKVAYYAFTSLFPLILVVLTLTGILGGQRAFDWIMGRIQSAVPPETAGLIGNYVAEVTNRPHPGLLSIGALLVLWSSSAVVVALADALNAAFDVEETRGYVKRHVVALVLALFFGALLVASALALLVGPSVASSLHLGLVWTLLRWPIALALLASGLLVVYAVLPNARTRGAWPSLAIGAIVGAIAWVVATAPYVFA
jgi:membrane protein